MVEHEGKCYCQAWDDVGVTTVVNTLLGANFFKFGV